MLFARVSSQQDPVIAREARTYSRQESGATAGLLACLAVFDERKAHRALGFATMLDYCQRDLHLTEDSAKKYLSAARTARDYPVVFDMIADRRLSVSAVLTLRPWLEPHSADELLAAAAGKSREEIDWLLAERFPQSDVLTLETGPWQPENVQALSPNSAPGHPVPSEICESNESMAPLPSSANLTPLSADRVSLQVTMSRTTREKLRRAQELLGHEVASDDVAGVLDRALDQLIVVLEKRKHGLHRKRRAARAAAQDPVLAEPADTPAARAAQPTPRITSPKPCRPRYIAGAVRAEVYQRDHGRCTFVGDNGERCESRHALEYDHITAVADGGQATASNLRLLCASHNQLEAERRFGVGFMQRKRAGRGRALTIHDDREQLKVPHENDVRAALVQLGCRPAHVGAALCAAAMLSPSAGLDERLRAALKTCKPGNAVTTKPRDAVTTKPGDAVTIKPGDAVTTKPDDAVTIKPCDAVTTKPDDAGTLEGGDVATLKPDSRQGAVT